MVLCLLQTSSFPSPGSTLQLDGSSSFVVSLCFATSAGSTATVNSGVQWWGRGGWREEREERGRRRRGEEGGEGKKEEAEGREEGGEEEKKGNEKEKGDELGNTSKAQIDFTFCHYRA